MISMFELTFIGGRTARTTDLDEVKRLVRSGVEVMVKTVLLYTPCSSHPAFEPTNCPGCGTSATV